MRDSRAVNKFIGQTHQQVCLFVSCLSCIWLARIPGLSVRGYADRLDVRLHILGWYGPHWLVSGNHYYILVPYVCVPGISLTLPGIMKSENPKWLCFVHFLMFFVVYAVQWVNHCMGLFSVFPKIIIKKHERRFLTSIHLLTQIISENGRKTNCCLSVDKPNLD